MLSGTTSAIIGADIFHHFTLSFDYSQSRIYVTRRVKKFMNIFWYCLRAEIIILAFVGIWCTNEFCYKNQIYAG